MLVLDEFWQVEKALLTKTPYNELYLLGLRLVFLQQVIHYFKDISLTPSRTEGRKVEVNEFSPKYVDRGNLSSKEVNKGKKMQYYEEVHELKLSFGIQCINMTS